MDDLLPFDEPADGASRQEAPPSPVRLRALPDLPAHAGGYANRPRASADPLGDRGLPEDRASLDGLLVDLCARLIAAGGRCLSGRQLVAEMGLTDSRALRLLVAYGHVHHRLRQIVGLPGHGYSWGDLGDAQTYQRISWQAARMGRCHLYLAALYSHRPPEVEIAQLMLDFPGMAGDREPDELASLLAAHGVGAEQILDASILALRQQPGGAEALGRVAARHADILLPAASAAAIRQHLEQALAALPPRVGGNLPTIAADNPSPPSPR